MSDPYGLVPRTTNKTNGKPLSGHAFDITIRVNGEGAYFLEDHNSDRNVMPHTNRDDLIATIVQALEAAHVQRFGTL